MRKTAADEQRKDDFPSQTLLRNEIKKGLKNTSIRSFVDRTCYNHGIRLSHECIGFHDRLTLKLRMNQILRRKFGNIDVMHLNILLFEELLGQSDNGGKTGSQRRIAVNNRYFCHFSCTCLFKLYNSDVFTML
ncbi:hypothetical protein D3C73_341550 [compost metagenome]